MINYSIKKQWTKLITAVMVFIFLLTVFGCLYYWIRTINETRRLEEKKMIIKSNAEEFANRLKKALEISKNDRTRLESHFVRRDQVVDFINQLEEIGKKIGVESKVASLDENWSKTEDNKKDDPNGILTLGLKISGKFVDVYRYLLLLEQIPEQLEIKEIALDSSFVPGAPTTKKEIKEGKSIFWMAIIKADVFNYMRQN